MQIFGWAADQGGCGYYRIGLPLHYLAEQYDDIECASSVMLPDSVRCGDQGDVIVGQRVCIPGATITWNELFLAGRHTVFEIDDDLWDVHELNFGAHEFFAKPDVREALSRNLRASELVTTTNEYLADVLVRHGARQVVVIPNFIDGRLLDEPRLENDHVQIGWAGGASHTVDFQVVKAPLGRFFRRNPEVSMTFLGCDFNQVLKAERCFVMPWTEDCYKHVARMNFDIGIAPLASNSFNRSKSYIKALEYAARGIPCVASNVRPYREFIRHGETGFLVTHEHEWGRYLYQLVNDEAMRKEMGANAKALAAQHTIQANVSQWEKVYRALVSPGIQVHSAAS